MTESRQQAQGLIDAGRVLVCGSIADKASRQVAPGEPVEIIGPPPRYVSRGGEKLAGGLARFAVEVSGRRCLDAGASTGGFTDALLQAGAESVLAVDVGRHQLHERLRLDPRVDSREQTDIRDVDGTAIGAPFDVVVADLSFISLGAVIDALVGLLADDGDLVVLVKPQFEAGRAEVSRGRGVIRAPSTWRQTLDSAVGAITGAGAAIMDAMVSPLRGAEGNVEFLLHCRPTSSATTSGPDPSELLDQAVDAAVARSEVDGETRS